MATKEIELKKGEGFYYRALVWHWLFVAVVFPFVIIATIVAVINPFWFRNGMFNTVEQSIYKIARWRDRIKYRIYLGTDPELWHALKD